MPSMRRRRRVLSVFGRMYSIVTIDTSTIAALANIDSIRLVISAVNSWSVIDIKTSTLTGDIAGGWVGTGVTSGVGSNVVSTRSEVLGSGGGVVLDCMGIVVVVLDVGVSVVVLDVGVLVVVLDVGVLVVVLDVGVLVIMAVVVVDGEESMVGVVDLGVVAMVVVVCEGAVVWVVG
jgi:hypothetical protein